MNPNQTVLINTKSLFLGFLVLLAMDAFLRIGMGAYNVRPVLSPEEQKKREEAAAPKPEVYQRQGASRPSADPYAGGVQVEDLSTHEKFSAEMERNEEPQYNAGYDGRQGGYHQSGFHQVHIQYCEGCSYVGEFQKMKQSIEYNFPQVSVVGSVYPLSPTQNMLSTLFTITQYGLIILMIFGDTIFAKFAIVPPRIYYTLKEKKLLVLIGLFMFGNNIKSMITNTGAFEIFFDNELLYSKIAQKAMPQIQTVLQMIDRNMVAL
jgi:selT/selW/selH-like putative selenoprotein